MTAAARPSEPPAGRLRAAAALAGASVRPAQAVPRKRPGADAVLFGCSIVRLAPLFAAMAVHRLAG